MQEQISQYEPHEKMMTTLHRSYSQALFLLKKGQFTQGIQSLITILLQPYINDVDLQNLKYSVLVSLGEVYHSQGDFQSSLGFFWKGLEVLQLQWKQGQQGQTNGRQNHQKPDEEFTLILKMIFLMEKMNHPQELIYLLKRAIKISPTIWRDKLLLKLRSLYQKYEQCQNLADLDYLMENTEKMQEILSEKVYREQHQDFQQLQTKEDQQYLQKIKICINLTQKDEILMKYSSWETFFTITYVLLKCQNNRNFNKKKYLHKKFDQNNKNWNHFLKTFSKTRTKIEIMFVENEDNQNLEQSDGQMVSEIAQQILKAKYAKKKIKKPVNPFEQLTRIPSLSSKDSKKGMVPQTKSIFSSIREYYKELFGKSTFEKECLTTLKILDQGLFDEILGQILSEQPEKMKAQGDQNSDDDNQASFSMGQGLNQGDKETVKQKKSHKVRKMQLITNQKDLNSLIKSFFKISGNQSVVFANVCQMIEEIMQILMEKSQEVSNKKRILGNSGIRKILQKNILKVMETASGYFEKIDSLDFCDMLMEKLEQLIDKDTRSQTFKDHQDHKKHLLVEEIRTKFLPTTHQFQTFLENDISLELTKKLSHVCHSMVKLNSCFEITSPEQVLFYRDLFICFKTKQYLKTSESKEEIEKKVRTFIDKEIEKYQKKVEQRSRLLSINQQKEEKNMNVDDVYKKDQQILCILPLLKVFNCHPDQIKSKQQLPEEINPKVYLQSFSKLSRLFFKKIQIESKNEFNIRLLTLLGEIVKIKQIITFLYDKFMDGVTFKAPNSQLDLSTCTQTIFYLLKFYLLSITEQKDECLKICFYLLNSIIKIRFDDNEKYLVVPKLICSLDELIKYRRGKFESNYSIRKKFYQHFILKNLNYVFKSPLFQVQTVENKDRRNKKGRKGKFVESDDEPSLIQIVQRKDPEHDSIRDKVYDVLHNVYFCPEKDRQFTPKRIEEAIGYFMYLLRAYNDVFQDRVIQLQSQALKVFKKCYKLYSQKKDDVYTYCEKFKDFKKTFYLVLNGEENKIDKESFLSVIKQQKPICECCSSLPISHPFYIESLFVLGKFYEAQFAESDLTLCHRQQWLEDFDKDEEYYFEYLAFNLDKESAWQNLIRSNASKTFFYFDSILTFPIQRFKNKFFVTKKLIHLVTETCPQFNKITIEGSGYLQILNILKIKEREYMMVQKDLETRGIASKESKELEKKYIEGVKRIFAASGYQTKANITIRYLKMSQIRFKLIWHNFQKSMIQDKSRKSSVVIQVDEESNESKTIYPPTHNVLQLRQCIQQVKLMIQEIPAQAESNTIAHLEEDLVMETYVFLCKHLQKKLQNIIESLKFLISSAIPERFKLLNKIQFHINDLSHTLNLFEKGTFLTNNSKYKFNDDSLSLTSTDSEIFKTNFEKIFTPKEQIQEPRILQEELDDPIIFIKDDPNKSEESEGKNSKRSRSKSSTKKEPISKVLTIELGSYISETMTQYIKQKQLYNSSLNHLQNIFKKSLFQESIIRAGKILSELCRISMELPKYQTRRYKNRRSVVFSLLYCAHLTGRYLKTPRRANQLIRDYYSFKGDQFTCINLYNDKIVAEKNELLSDFYSRSIVHNIMKIKFIREVFLIFKAMGHKDNLVLLNKKMLKLSKTHDPKSEKEKPQKEAMEDEGNTKKELKGLKEVKDPKNIETSTYFFLFSQGALKFTEMVQEENKQVDEKYERNLLQFRNKIKKWSGDEKNVYYQRIQGFISDYQNRFQKKIKLKKAKQPRQLAEDLVKNEEKNVHLQGPPVQLPLTFSKKEEKSPSVKSKNSNDPGKEKTPANRKKKIQKKEKEKKEREKVPRGRKRKLLQEQLKQEIHLQQGRAEQPIQIRESPENDNLKDHQQQIKTEKGKRTPRIPRTITDKKK